MIIVTGGTGFIGSSLVWALNEKGIDDIVIVDELDHDRKSRNIGHLRYEQLVGIQEFRQQLKDGEWDNKEVSAVIHLGACSDTTETDWDYLADNNVEYSKDIIRWCFDKNIRCLYASSAATYGDGEKGFDDDHDLFNELEPLNLYGKSKLEVDIWARDGGYLDKVVGLRYFNVYGPNEWHKEGMRSVINKKFEEMKEEGVIRLFKSDHPDYADGEQERDFVYIKDALKATMFFLDHPEVAGVFNIGRGEVGTWKQVAQAMFKGASLPEKIEYVDMPDKLKGKYQYHTKAKIDKLRQSGFNESFETIEDSVVEYVKNYLEPDLHLGE